jgi:hypothetical protein
VDGHLQTCAVTPAALSKRPVAGHRGAQTVKFGGGCSATFSAHHTTPDTTLHHTRQPEPRLWATHCITPPPGLLALPFSSCTPTFYHTANLATTSFRFPAPRLCLCLTLTTVRTYASAKKPKMPPKKVVKEEKLLLGRPGNSLKSGIVSPHPCVAVVVVFSH